MVVLTDCALSTPPSGKNPTHPAIPSYLPGTQFLAPSPPPSFFLMTSILRRPFLLRTHNKPRRLFYSLFLSLFPSSSFFSSSSPSSLASVPWLFLVLCATLPCSSHPSLARPIFRPRLKSLARSLAPHPLTHSRPLVTFTVSRLRFACRQHTICQHRSNSPPETQQPKPCIIRNHDPDRKLRRDDLEFSGDFSTTNERDLFENSRNAPDR